MAKPSSRQELIDYCLRKLGAPVLEINVAQEQIEDLVDDAIQLFNERHFDGVYQTYLKYQLTENDVQRGRARDINGVGVSTSSATVNIAGNELQFDYFENSNYLQIPSHITGVNRIFHIENFNYLAGTGMFDFKYQFFLNDMYNWGSFEILSYAMLKTYLEDIDFVLNTQKQIRYNQRQDRLYLDLNWRNISPGQFIVIDCWRLMDPNDYKKVWNDSFIKPYLTSLIKRQWGINLSAKFKGMKLPGGVEYNGRELFEDAQREIDALMEKMSSYYELPPLDMIG